MELTIIVPFYNGETHIEQLLDTLPVELPVIIVDDHSDVPYQLHTRYATRNIRVIRPETKGYFTGACNVGMLACETDVLILNQDVSFSGSGWLNMLREEGQHYAMIGERIRGKHPAYPMGYIHGTFLFARRDAITAVGLMDAVHYPLWGSTCEWQLRFSRKGFSILPLEQIPGFQHHREPGERFGDSIQTILAKEPEQYNRFTQTPPLISMIVPCYNYGRYLPDLVNSLIGGPTCLGDMPGQTLQSFEIILVDDRSTDNSWEIMQSLADPWKGIFCIRRDTNGGTPAAINTGFTISNGRYITTMSADDMREERSLELLYGALEKHPHSFSYDDFRLVMNHQRSSKGFCCGEFDFASLVEQNSIHAGIMFPRKAMQDIGGYPEKMREGREDWAVNIALALQAYCGVHVHYPGYLYRREGQNRTLSNTTAEYKRYFAQQVRDLFPAAYDRSVQMACCGGRTTNTNTPTPQPGVASTSEIMPGSSGMVPVEYVGGNFGTQTLFGPVTGTTYRFNASKRIFLVDVRDLETQDQRGILQIAENRHLLFQRANVPVAREQAQKIVDNTIPVVQISPDVTGEVVTKVVSENPGQAGPMLIEDAPKTVELQKLESVSILEVPKIGKTLANRLTKAGITTALDIYQADIAHLAEVLGWTEEKALTLHQSVEEMLNV